MQVESSRAGRRAEGRLLAPLRYSSLLEASIALGVTAGTYALLGLAFSAAVLVLASCGTFLVYQADRSLGYAMGWAPEDAHTHAARVAWVRRHRAYVIVSSALAVVGGGLGWVALRPAAQLLAAGLGLLALGYVAPVLPAGRLKGSWLAKPVAVAGVWAVGAVAMPALAAGTEGVLAVVALSTYRFLLVLPNALLSDWPDRQGDARAGLRSVATEWPLGRLQKVSLASVATALVGAGAAVALGAAPVLLMVDAVGGGLTAAWVLLAGRLDERRYGLVLDLLVAWPAVTAAAAWLGA